MSEYVTAPELHRALRATLAQLAPTGGNRSITCNLFCDVLITLLANLLTSAQPGTENEIERLTMLFRDKLAAAMAERHHPAKH